MYKIKLVRDDGKAIIAKLADEALAKEIAQTFVMGGRGLRGEAAIRADVIAESGEVVWSINDRGVIWQAD